MEGRFDLTDGRQRQRRPGDLDAEPLQTDMARLYQAYFASRNDPRFWTYRPEKEGASCR